MSAGRRGGPRPPLLQFRCDTTRRLSAAAACARPFLRTPHVRAFLTASGLPPDSWLASFLNHERLVLAPLLSPPPPRPLRHAPMPHASHWRSLHRGGSQTRLERQDVLACRSLTTHASPSPQGVPKNAATATDEGFPLGAPIRPPLPHHAPPQSCFASTRILHDILSPMKISLTPPSVPP